MKTLKSIGAVIAGVLFTILVTTAVDVGFYLLHFFPGRNEPINDLQAALATLYRIPISIAGAYLTAKLAPDRPMLHAILLGYVGTILALLGAFATWEKHLNPHWYALALAVLALPQCWAGGKLYQRGLTAPAS